MSVMTIEGIVVNGQIQLTTKVQLPEKTKVYVVVPNIQLNPTARIVTPRLANTRQAADFKLEILPGKPKSSTRRVRNYEAEDFKPEILPQKPRHAP